MDNLYVLSTEAGKSADLNGNLGLFSVEKISPSETIMMAE
jgi:hypothetical protein